MKILKFILKPISFIPAILIMYMIYSFSAQDSTESSKLSYSVSYKAVKIVDKELDLNLSEKQITHSINKIHHYIRKLAHFSEYFLLAVSIAIPLYVYGLRGILLVLAAGVICVGVASSDEFHQLFVYGRGASVKDVLIDSSGAFVGIYFVRIFGYIARKAFFEPIFHQK
jgi:VanZ family protein